MRGAAAASAAAATPPSTGTPRFGTYALLKELGRGGQGVVYEAEDLRLGRRVALKLLTGAYAADHWTRLRFEREAAAAARLDHPGICTVYEAGTVLDVPFIAMRLVPGETVGERIRRARAATDGASPSAGPSQRRQTVFADVEIIEKAALALHVAHEAGLVHRDIKPGNLMLERAGQPVVLDFGLAQDAHSGDLSLTGTGTFLGTPAYMSPEQAEGSAPVDRRTDIWSLGVTLYEMTTLRRPFEGPTLEALLRAIRTVEPEDPRRLNPAVTPELAAVIMTALDKDPARRYQDALSFADDLRRARSFEPVRARPATVFTRLRRWTQRNPVVAASLAFAFVALVTGLAVSLHSLDRTQAALAGETAALAQAKIHRASAEDLVSFMLVDLKGRLAEVGKLELLGKVARKAGDYYATRTLDLDDQPDALRRALFLRNLGEVVSAEGDSAEALRRYEEARAIQQQLCDRSPQDATALRELAATINSIAAVQMIRGENDGALANAEKSLALRRRLVEIAPGDPENTRLLAAGMVMRGNTLKAAGRNADALAQHREATEAWRRLSASDTRPAWRRELGVSVQNLAEALRAAGDADGAIKSRREGLAIFQSLAEAEPENREWAEQLATGRHGLALALRERHELPAALEQSAGAIAIFRRLLAEDPVNSRRLYQLGHALNVQGVLQEESAHRDDAYRSFVEVGELRARLCRLDARNVPWRTDRAITLRTVARLEGERGDVTPALKTLGEALEILRALAGEDPTSAGRATRLGNALGDAVRYCREAGRTLDAERFATEALDAHAAAAARQPQDAAAAAAVAGAARELAALARAAGHLTEASTLLVRQVDERRRAAGLATKDDAFRSSARIGFALSHRGSEELAMGHHAAAEEALRAAVEHLAALAVPHDAAAEIADEVRAETLRARFRLAQVLWMRCSLDEAGRVAQAAVDEREDARPSIQQFTAREHGPELVANIARLRALLGREAPETALDHALLALHHAAGGRPAEALPHFQFVLDHETGRDLAIAVTMRTFLHAGTVSAARLLAAGKEGAPDLDTAATIGARCLAIEVKILRDSIRDLDADLRRERAAGSDQDPLRERLAELRCALDALRTLDPDLAPLRARPEFQQIFDGA